MPSASTKHTSLGASKSGRWLKCKGSVGLIERLLKSGKIKPEPPSPHAAEGSKAHKLAELMLKGKKYDAKQYDPEMMEHCTGFVKFVHTQKAAMLRSKMHVELAAPLYFDKSQVGTADVILAGEKTVTVIDLKYGVGVSVEAIRNAQLAIYLKSALVNLKLKLPRDRKLVLIIYQPRAMDGRFVRKWETTVSELEELCDQISDTALDILADPDNQPFHADPDTTCRWCPAKPRCTAYAANQLGDLPPKVEKALALTKGDTLSEQKFPDPKELTDDQLSRLVGAASDLRDWLDEIYAHAKERMDGGDPIPGTKLVAGRGSRWWSDEDKAFRAMRRFIPREECHTKTLLSPAQVEKRLKSGKLRRKPSTRGSNKIAALIVSTPGNPQLVHISDSREPINADISML